MEPSTRTGAIVFTLIAVFMYWLAFDQRESGDIWFWIINIAAGSMIKALGLVLGSAALAVWVLDLILMLADR